MNDIVKIINNQATTTSLDIANGLGVQHASIIKLIKKYQDDFSETNLLRFEIRPRLENQWGGGDMEIIILDEHQATLLLTYMRNSPKVRAFKKALVKAFFDARALLQTDTMTLLHKHALLCTIFDNEKGQASDFGKGLAEWKKIKDGLQTAIDKVERQLQPELPHFSQE